MLEASSVSLSQMRSLDGLVHYLVRPNEVIPPLSHLSLSEKECKQIQSRVINASLSMRGFSRKMARAIVFCSPWLGGLGWRCFFFEQGIQYAVTLIKHLRTPGPFHSLLQICLQWY